MPELPEVDTVRAGLVGALGLPGLSVQVLGAEVRTPKLRVAVPGDLGRLLEGQSLLAIQRRAKYLLWQCSNGFLLNHLGMTGSWRFDDGAPWGRHDHVVLFLDGNRRLIYRDPRRFGQLTWHPGQAGDPLPGLSSLGPEPLSADFSGAALGPVLARRRGPIKAAIMDQAVVVGVGNIYAAEALFRAGIRPLSPAHSLGRRRLERLVAAIKAVLLEAIQAGGSTIRDFRQAGGSEGYFQHSFAVYGRLGQPCLTCGSTIRGQVIAGRASCWCPRCQRL